MRYALSQRIFLEKQNKYPERRKYFDRDTNQIRSYSCSDLF